MRDIQMRKPYHPRLGGVLSDESLNALRKLLAETGTHKAAKMLGCGRETLLELRAGGRVQPAVAARIARKLEEKEFKLATEVIKHVKGIPCDGPEGYYWCAGCRCFCPENAPCPRCDG